MKFRNNLSLHLLSMHKIAYGVQELVDMLKNPETTFENLKIQPAYKALHSESRKEVQKAWKEIGEVFQNCNLNLSEKTTIVMDAVHALKKRIDAVQKQTSIVAPALPTAQAPTPAPDRMIPVLPVSPKPPMLSNTLSALMHQIKTGSISKETLSSSPAYASLPDVVKSQVAQFSEMVGNIRQLDILDNEKSAIITDYEINFQKNFSWLLPQTTQISQSRLLSGLSTVPFHALLEHHPILEKNQNEQAWLDHHDIAVMAGDAFAQLGLERSTFHVANNLYSRAKDVRFGFEQAFEIPLQNFKSNPFSLQDKFSVVLNTGSHWTSLTLLKDSDNSKKAYVLYRDSFGTRIPRDIEKTIKKYYPQAEFLSNQSSLQRDGYSCGIFASLAAVGDYLLPNKEIQNIFKQRLSSQEKINRLNQRIAQIEKDLFRGKQIAGPSM